jgi:multiple sugar transport system permease protein
MNPEPALTNSKIAGSILKPKKSQMGREQTFYGYLFLAPSLIGFIIFILIPTIGSSLLSFLKWDLITIPKFVGIQNYQYMLQDELFWTVLKNTLVYTIGTIPIGMFLSFIIAYLLNQKIKGVNIYRAVYFLPVMASATAVAVIWKWIFEKDFGLFNYFLSILGITNGPPWLASSKWAMSAVIIMNIWRHVGYDMVIYLAALQGISKEYYESAYIDGANTWHILRYITIPLVSYSTFFILIMNIIRSMQVFDTIFVMTHGGPGYATQVLVYYIYTNAFQYFKMGSAAACAWVLFLIIFIFTMIQMKAQKKWVHYN